jgi:hypothetical protein
MEKCPEESCNIRLLDRRQNPYNQKEDLITVTERRVFQDEYYSIYYIKCNKCGHNFGVTEDPGYHSPQYSYPNGI